MALYEHVFLARQDLAQAVMMRKQERDRERRADREGGSRDGGRDRDGGAPRARRDEEMA